MKIIRNDYLPIDGFGVMNILGLLFVRMQTLLTECVIRHEAIHSRQQYEILTIGAIVALLLSNLYSSWWYLLAVIITPIVLYVIGYLAELAAPPYHKRKIGITKGDGLCIKIKKTYLFVCKICKDAYYDNCFEREAYQNEHNPMYLANRIPCAWLGYIIKNRKEE